MPANILAVFLKSVIDPEYVAYVSCYQKKASTASSKTAQLCYIPLIYLKHSLTLRDASCIWIIWTWSREVVHQIWTQQHMKALLEMFRCLQFLIMCKIRILWSKMLSVTTEQAPPPEKEPETVVERSYEGKVLRSTMNSELVCSILLLDSLYWINMTGAKTKREYSHGDGWFMCTVHFGVSFDHFCLSLPLFSCLLSLPNFLPLFLHLLYLIANWSHWSINPVGRFDQLPMCTWDAPH